MRRRLNGQGLPHHPHGGRSGFVWLSSAGNIDNVDPATFTLVSKAFANTVVRMAFDNKIMSASSDYVTKTKPTLKAGTSRRFPAK